MKRGLSIAITSTDSAVTRHFFISNRWVKVILAFAVLLFITAIIAVANYSRVYYQALESVMLKHRNAELEREFIKIQEIKRNLEIAESNNTKLKIMLGVEKAPRLVEPDINKTSPEYSNRINVIVEKEQNIPSLLPTRGHISRSFGLEHEGIDIAAPRFAPVVAAASGVVSSAGWDSIFGNYVVIEHNINYSTFYGHLNSVAVKETEKVACGSVIGTVGSTGKSTSPHLHYEIRFRNKPVNPAGYLQFLLNIRE